MTQSRAATLARLSWIIPIAGIVVTAVFRSSMKETASDSPALQGRAEGQICGVLLFYVAGIVVAIMALAAARTHGAAGIRVPAIVGLILNALFLAITMGMLFQQSSP